MQVPIKYLLLLIISIISAYHSLHYRILPGSIFEILFIFCITNIISKNYKKTSYVVNSLLSFIFLLQQGTLFFSGEYLSPTMIENLGLIDSLGSSLYMYYSVLLLALIISLLPIRFIRIFPYYKMLYTISLIVLFAIYIFSQRYTREIYSPFYAMYKTTEEIIQVDIYMNGYKVSDKERQALLNEFYNDSIVTSNVITDKNVPKSPNIILLFIEGMSMNVLDIANNLNLNLTPNIDSLYNKSIIFKNYFNHTAPTFRGIKGQLSSSFCLTGFPKNEDSNYLISIVDILKKNNYNTSFINVDPSHKLITSYSKSLRFDTIYPKVNSDEQPSLSDKQAFNLLYDLSLNQKLPFLMCMYTSGTHHGMESPDLKYREGKNPVLNRFHNLDYQFGVFFNKLKNSGLLENTILILTTDHASFASPEYKETFKKDRDFYLFIDKIPLIIYWDKIKHEVIDANGRNSLDLAPTILDLIGINHHNYFLGNSLFINKKNKYNTTSAIGEGFFDTKNNQVVYIKDETNIIKQIRKYYSISK